MVDVLQVWFGAARIQNKYAWTCPSEIWFGPGYWDFRTGVSLLKKVYILDL